jgi:sugar phosphate isomerase/epimerase
MKDAFIDVLLACVFLRDRTDVEGLVAIIMTTFSLAYLTSAPLSAPDAVALAARCGYGAVGLRALPAMPGGDTNGLMGAPAVVRETMARVRDTGVAVFDVEIVRIGEAFNCESLKPFLDVCAALGAKAILVAGDDPDLARLTGSFAAFCDAAAPYGLSANLEFMPWTKVPDAKTALGIVQAADRPNGGILVDTLHASRSRSTLADIAAIPANRLHYAQMCDAPAEIPTTVDGLLYTARHARLLPGQGGIDLAGMIGALQATVPISLELPNDREKAAMGVEAWCQQAIEAARFVLGAGSRDLRAR